MRDGAVKRPRQEEDSGGGLHERRSGSSQRGRKDVEGNGHREPALTSDRGRENDRRQRDNGRGDEGGSFYRRSKRDNSRGRDERCDRDASGGHRERSHNDIRPSIHQGGRGIGRGGRGRGSGTCRGGGRAAQKKNDREEFDLVVSRPQTEEGQAMSKQAVLGNALPVNLQANYFQVARRPKWGVFHYRVDFKPDETDTKIKKMLLRQHIETLPANIFDGSSLYSTTRKMMLYSKQENTDDMVELSIRLVAEVAATDCMYLQLLNILVRKCLEAMGLDEINRNFYDSNQAIKLEAHHLQLWPGYKTSIRNHENSILLGVELTHKVLRLDSCLQVINDIQRRCYDRSRVRNELVGSIVMTVYNRQTYQVDDIKWDSSPTQSFDFQGKQITFMDYFKTKYNINISDPRQPLLVSRPKKKDFHRGTRQPILLIPELCQMTGLSEEMRSNYQLMKSLAVHTQVEPAARVAKLNDFMNRLQTDPKIVEELLRWGLKFRNRLVDLPGRVVPSESIKLGDGKVECPNTKYEWTNAFRDKPMYSSIPLKTWVVIMPGIAAAGVDKLIKTMQHVAAPLKFVISTPVAFHRIGSSHPNEYARAVDDVMNKYKDSIQLLFVILPKIATDTYAAIKKRATLEFGIPSQCFVTGKPQIEKNLSSVCTKLVVQMNAKIGGVPWTVHNPMQKLMVVGFDLYHCGKRKGASVGAMAASTCDSLAKYYSTASYLPNKDALSDKVGVDFAKCLHAYQIINKVLPSRIIMYRDGVGDGQLKYVFETELRAIRETIKSIYKSSAQPEPKFTFIVVTKKINTRLFASQNNGRPINPRPGTVVDDVITLPERYDFYLVSQSSPLGCAAPVSYNVLYDTQGLDPNKLQRFTYKLCHMYFNWSSTITVPAPCQYAHKLAYLTGLSLGAPSSERLANSLHFL
ncbi:Protein aubergine [Orchesella cincta]|uniref:Protein aubergine n=1 Tax=Orchesella cincta TaxID=48709 RepID=A0A1D2NEQ1_ORCCI|nr:Protein aubergine [Orchesella cincta]